MFGNVTYRSLILLLTFGFAADSGRIYQMHGLWDKFDELARQISFSPKRTMSPIQPWSPCQIGETTLGHRVVMAPL